MLKRDELDVLRRDELTVWRRLLLLLILLAPLRVGLITAQTDSKQSAVIPMPTVSDSVAMAFFEELGVPITAGNHVELFFNGHDKFEDLFSAIRQARHLLSPIKHFLLRKHKNSRKTP